MEFPRELGKQLDDFVYKLDAEDCVIDRHIAIREVARLLICLAHDEYYNNIDAFDKKYSDISDACRTFMGM